MHPFGFRLAIRSRDISSHLCPLHGLYTSAPHGARRTAGTRPAGQPGPTSARPGRDRQRPELVEGEATVRSGAGHVLDPVQLGVPVRPTGTRPLTRPPPRLPWR